MTNEFSFTLFGLLVFGIIILANFYQTEVDKQLIKKESVKQGWQIVRIAPLWIRHFFFRTRAYQVRYKDPKNQVQEGECIVQWRTVYWQDSDQRS